jgi:hypothetical protein
MARGSSAEGARFGRRALSTGLPAKARMTPVAYPVLRRTLLACRSSREFLAQSDAVP